MDTIILIVFAVVILGGIGGVIGYQVIKYLKGSLDIKTPKKNYHFGEEIIGYVILVTKKSIESRGISIHLILHEKQTSYTQGKSRTTTVEILRYTHEIETGMNYLAGIKKDFDFKLLIPAVSDIPEVSAAIERKQLFSKYYSRIPNSQRFTWSLRVELDCEGVNLSGRKTVTVENNIHNENI